MSDTPAERQLNFIEQIIEADNASGKWGGKVVTRFPPEPNGYLHIGHAKSICLNFGLAQRYGGTCNLRFDDTNPTKEEMEYVHSISDNIRWLGFEWPNQKDDAVESGALFASDYFQTMYDYACELIRKGKAYVCDLTADETREYRGSLNKPGRESPHRNRSVEENLDLFDRMRKGEFPDGSRTLKAKIDMASPNVNLRDPVMYRILHAKHHRTGDAWCIYPMYDWAHGIEDSLEGVTHSICTLEFENHRPLYDWFINAINEGRTNDGSGPWGKRIVHSQQIEFAKLDLNYTVMGKRNLLALVKEKRVGGWDDPRMPTLSGLRRRGYTPESIRNFCTDVGVAKFKSTIDIGRLENAVRDHLNKVAPRRMAVLDPLKVVIENWPEDGTVDELDAINNPEDASAGSRKVPFTRELYIEREDFMEDAPKKFFRLAPGREVRLRYAYFVTCTGVVKNDAGEIVELRCTYDPATRGGDSPDGRKVKGTLHWVSASHAVEAEVRLYDRLFNDEDPDNPRHEKDFHEFLNPDSLKKVHGCKLEPSLAQAAIGDRMQFERLGYFNVDIETTPGNLIFNRIVSLKDSWAKQRDQ
ncbi:MAG: glutamine--tRNA ligase/YqeY domain fusion protein [Phycisphaerales bacterium]|nr:glutamine--tRNA ligase/YqeY domain fusion protein [Phycisphaerales bacterium]